MVSREWIGESIDKLVSIELRPQGFLNNIVHNLYMQVRKGEGVPLTWLTASDLVDKVNSNTVVYIATGHVHPAILPNGETDGPPGAAALARALRMGLGARVVLLTEPAVLSVLQQTCRAVGLQAKVVDSGKDLISAPPLTVGIMAFPMESNEAKLIARKLLDDDVTAIITIEKIGRNSNGVYCTGLGNDVSKDLCKVDLLVDYAREKDILTVGIGDLGNEIGFGNFQNLVESIVPFPAIACTVATSRLVVAGVSNWGAYGVVAALAIKLENERFLHTSELEKMAIFASCSAGAVDGLSGGPTYEVDGLSYKTHMSIVRLLENIVQSGLAKNKVERLSFEVED